jgi:hypothetical protein
MENFYSLRNLLPYWKNNLKKLTLKFVTIIQFILNIFIYFYNLYLSLVSPLSHLQLRVLPPLKRLCLPLRR